MLSAKCCFDGSLTPHYCGWYVVNPSQRCDIVFFFDQSKILNWLESCTLLPAGQLPVTVARVALVCIYSSACLCSDIRSHQKFTTVCVFLCASLFMWFPCCCCQSPCLCGRQCGGQGSEAQNTSLPVECHSLIRDVVVLTGFCEVVDTTISDYLSLSWSRSSHSFFFLLSDIS